MDRHNSVDAILPPRKEKAKFHGHNSADLLILEKSDLAKHCASDEVKKRRKTNSSSNARARLGHAERLSNSQVLHRMETLKKARGRSIPKRGDVKTAIFRELMDTTRGFWCSSPTLTLDADSFLEDAPFPTKSQVVATLWPKMDMPECGKTNEEQR